jgi:hypothetical protein
MKIEETNFTVQRKSHERVFGELIKGNDFIAAADLS